MSQMVTRKAAVSDDKDKRQTDSPVKEMKKKLAANAEKEKQAAEKNAEKTAEKTAEKPSEKSAEKRAEKASEKNVEKKAEKAPEKKAEKAPEKTAEKPAEKAQEKTVDKNAEKKVDRNQEKKTEAQTEKEDSNKGEKSGKSERQEEKQRKTDKVKQNGARERTHNGVSDVTLAANGGAGDALNGTVSGDSDDEMLVIDEHEHEHEHEHDELFPELTYDDTSDNECFDKPTPTPPPDSAPARSLTRRSQVKVTRTPETPRPASDKQTDKETNMEDSKDAKLLKVKDDALPTDRKLRSADSPKPQEVKKSQEKAHDSPKKPQEKAPEAKKVQDKDEKENKSQEEKENVDKSIDVEVVDVEGNQGAGAGAGAAGVPEEVGRKLDTNYAKSRVRVSPYRRARAADRTASSLLANYTGNNSTMEMDITESSLAAEEAPRAGGDSPYLSGLRAIRGRRSYKPLHEMALRLPAATANLRATHAAHATSAHTLPEQPSRPTGTVVGRKRKPDAAGRGEEFAGESAAGEADGEADGETITGVHSKRMRLLERIAQPFRRSAGSRLTGTGTGTGTGTRLTSTPLPARRAAEIVGINTDLPLTAPVASPDTFDPESLKGASTPITPAPMTPITPAVPAAPVTHDADRDGKRCVVM